MSKKPLYRIEFPKKRLKAVAQELRRIYLQERQVFSEQGFEFQLTRLLKLDPEKHKYSFSPQLLSKAGFHEGIEFKLQILLTQFKVLAAFNKCAGTCDAIYASIEEHV